MNLGIVLIGFGIVVGKLICCLAPFFLIYLGIMVLEKILDN